MLEEIRVLAAQTGVETGRPVFRERVMAALGRVPRHEFVPDEMKANAYENGPLPIGCRQTISQPYIVALMTDFLEVKPGDRVLEIGTGSGYQAAVLAELGAEVYTVEVIPELGRAAAQRLNRLGYANVKTMVGDGYAGWPGEAPFDAIIVTAAPKVLPDALLSQLRNGGRLVAPVGGDGASQDLVVVEKDARGRLHRRSVLGVRFVPMTDGRGTRY